MQKFKLSYFSANSEMLRTRIEACRRKQKGGKKQGWKRGVSGIQRTEKSSFHLAVSWKGNHNKGKRKKKYWPLKLQCLHVLTKWREAPSRACISTALTAGITTAPLTHAGSGDTTAPCLHAAWRVSEKVNKFNEDRKLKVKSQFC